jgi:hypothetical protein
LSVDNYRKQACAFGLNADLITANDEHIYYDGEEVAVADESTMDLYDSDTTDQVNADDLGITDDEYRQAVKDSLACDQAEGHIIVSGRRVFAA